MLPALVRSDWVVSLGMCLGIGGRLAYGGRRLVGLGVGAVDRFVERWALGDEQDIIAYREGGDGEDE